jgi:hypothetical protein
MCLYAIWLSIALLFFLLAIPCVDLFKTLRVQGCNVVVAIKRRLERDMEKNFWLETKQKLVNSHRFSQHLLFVDISGALLRVGSSAALLCISCTIAPEFGHPRLQRNQHSTGKC